MTDKAIEEIVQKFREFLLEHSNYLVYDPNDPRVGILARDVLEDLFRSSLLSYGSQCKEEGYKIGLIEGTMDGKEEAYKNVGGWYKLPEWDIDYDFCQTCGSLPVIIRGKHPHEDKRKICPVCTREVLESIMESCNNRQAADSLPKEERK